jgi:translocation and assembly module TamB
VTGSIAHWLTLARPWIAMDPWQIDGQSQATADVRAGSAAIDVSNAKATITNLKVVGVGWNIAEPRVELAADLHWNAANNEIASQSAQVVSSAIALATKDVHVKTGGAGPPQVTGVAAFRADVARLAAWQVPPSQPAPYQPQGMFTGNVRVVQQADRITGELSATGQNLVLSQWMAAEGATRAAGYQTIWQEPQVNIKGATTYDGATDQLAFQQLQVQSNTLQAAAAGQIEKLTTFADVTATGTLNYDLAQITPLLKPYVGDGVQLGGRETARFRIAGRLGGAPGVAIQNASYAGAATNPASALHWSRRLQAQVEVPWESANIYGLPLGGGKIAAALGEGALRIDPLALAVAEGQLNAAPNVQLDPEPMLLTLPKGPVLTNVKISPEVSEAMLKYIAPVLAGATQSEGQFSLQLDGARVPLLDTKKTDASGQLTVHSVRVVPGPMAKQWVDMAQQIQSLIKRTDAASAQGRQVTLLTVTDQQVNFKVADGRVYHQGMQFQIGDITCSSEGSVGLDETVAITLRLAIPDKWVEGQPVLAGFKGQQLAIPISGTLARPQMDQRAVASLSKQLIQGAAQQAVGGELDKALGKFFKPK